MAALRIRSVFTRLVLVAGLAAILATGSFSMMKPSHASAAKAMTCSQAWGISRGYLAMRDMFYAVGMYGEGNYYDAMSSVYFDYC
jgi:hypothetical protein